jgi:type IV pilus assembly protein PilA
MFDHFERLRSETSAKRGELPSETPEATSPARRSRVASEQGFTLIELLVVIVIIGILLAIAVPSYFGFTTKAQNATGAANVREALASVEAYYEQNNNSYSGISRTTLITQYDSGISPNVSVTPGPSPFTQACVEAPGPAGTTWYDLVPTGTITSTDPSTTICP